MQYLGKEQIISTTEKIFEAFTQACYNAGEHYFFKHNSGKWSVAETVQHLVITTQTAALAYKVPAFILRWIAGKPNRISRSYEALVEKYLHKLSEGAKSPEIFEPEVVTEESGKEKIMQQWKKVTADFLKTLRKNTSETKLDDYLVKHPLLGKITLRELCYFTIYHTQHHLGIIQNSPPEDTLYS